MAPFIGRLLAGLLLGTVAVALIFGATKNPGPEITLPLLIIGGVLVLLLALGLLSLLYQTHGLADRDRALALPEGSVRAVLALSLVLLFGIVAIFLYGTASKGSVVHERKLNTVERRAFLNNVAREPDIRVLLDQVVSEAVGETPAVHSVVYRIAQNPAGDDIAKQLIVLLGTLVTAVASFYFGANSVASATNSVVSNMKGGASDPALAVLGISPDGVSAGPQSQPFAIRGSNLDRAKTVRLIKDGNVVDVRDFSAKPASITFPLLIDEAKAGKWDVAVGDGNVEVTLQRALFVAGAKDPATASTTTSPTSTGRPSFTGIDPNPLARTTTSFTLRGHNLAGVTTVQLRRNGQTIAAPIQPPGQATQVTCTLIIPSEREQGKWEVVANDGTQDFALEGGVEITA